MHENDRRYRDGELIFREGDASHCAYVLISGSVDLSKKTEKGELTLAAMGPGEMFGEMGVFDLSARSATARAQGEVLLRTIPRDDFIESLSTRPEAALAVVGKLVKRLRASDERLAKAFGSGVITGATISPPTADASSAPKRTFLQRLLRLSEKEPKPKKLEVRIARLELAPVWRLPRPGDYAAFLFSSPDSFLSTSWRASNVIGLT